MALTKVSNSMLVQPVNHNILINPSFTVRQRGGVVEHTGISFGPDRWRLRGKNEVGGTKVESSTVVDDATGINKLVVKHPRDATDPIKSNANVQHRIEAVNLQGLYGKEMTLSFGYSDVGGSGIPRVTIGAYDSSATSKDVYNAVPISLGDNRWTCTVTLSTTDGTIPDPSERGMLIIIYANEANNAPDEWSLWETKLEVGSVATPFIARSYSEELALCKRYYEKQVIYQAPAMRSTDSGVGTVVNIFNPFYPKRAAPSVDFGAGGDSDKMSATTNVDSNTGIRLHWNSPTSISGGYIRSLTYSILLDSEL